MPKNQSRFSPVRCPLGSRQGHGLDSSVNRRRFRSPSGCLVGKPASCMAYPSWHLLPFAHGRADWTQGPGGGDWTAHSFLKFEIPSSRVSGICSQKLTRLGRTNSRVIWLKSFELLINFQILACQNYHHEEQSVMLFSHQTRRKNLLLNFLRVLADQFLIPSSPQLKTSSIKCNFKFVRLMYYIGNSVLNSNSTYFKPILIADPRS